MTTDTLNSNLLNGLFAKKDFQFLSNCSKEAEKFEVLIRKQQIKRDTIFRFTNKLHSIIPDEKASQFENLFSESQRYFEIVLKNIDMLSSVYMKMSNLAESTKGELLQAVSNNTEIKRQLLECMQEYQEVSNTFFINDLKVEHYLKEISSSTYTQHIKEHLATIDKTDSIKISAQESNSKLILSESKGIAILPYTLDDVKKINDLNPGKYSSQEELIRDNFVFPIERFTKKTVKSRFRESYHLLHEKEGKPRITSLKYSFDLAFCYDLNPAIIASCKTIQQLNYYLTCLHNNKLDEFNLFEIEYEITPLIK